MEMQALPVVGRELFFYSNEKRRSVAPMAHVEGHHEQQIQVQDDMSSIEPETPSAASHGDEGENPGKDKQVSQLVVRELGARSGSELSSPVSPSSPGPNGWPCEPLRLQRSVTSHVFIRGWDFITLILPVPFLVLAGFALALHGKLVDDRDWNKIQRGMELTVTAFPIFFAVITGRLTRAIATWRLERGTSLGVLEQLLGSSTLGGAVMTHWALRSYNLLGLGLVLIWALSPLGGQSSLHIMSTKRQTLSGSVDLSFLSTRPWPIFAYSGNGAVSSSQANALYLSAILSPESSKIAAMDTWGNVKIPVMSRLDGADNATGWREVNRTSEVVYTSLLGLPVSGVPTYGNTSFQIETSYYEFDCFDTELRREALPLIKANQLNMTDNNKPLRIAKVPRHAFIGNNGSYLCESVGCSPSLGIGMDQYIANRWTGNDTLFPNVTNNEATFLTEQPVFMFQSRYWSKYDGFYDWTSVARCHLSRMHVEAAVSCIGQSTDSRPQCAVTAMRDSLLPHPPRDATPFLFPIAMVNFAESLSTAGGYGHSATASLTERYLNNSADPLSADIDGFPLYQLPKKTFSERLTQVINTYYLASLRPQSLTGNLLTLVDPYYAAQIANTTGGTTSWEAPRYKVSAGWITVFILATITMLAGAVLTALTIHRTVIPDILGYVSTMTRDTPDSMFPAGATTLDGLERSRLLRDTPIQLGDVRPGDKEAGYLRLSVANLAERACRGRFYE